MFIALASQMTAHMNSGSLRDLVWGHRNLYKNLHSYSVSSTCMPFNFVASSFYRFECILVQSHNQIRIYVHCTYIDQILTCK